MIVGKSVMNIVAAILLFLLIVFLIVKCVLSYKDDSHTLKKEAESAISPVEVEMKPQTEPKEPKEPKEPAAE